MLSMSAGDIERLRRRSQPKAGGRAAPAIEEPQARKPAPGRLPLVALGHGTELVIRIPGPPIPKARARTSFDERALASAFKRAGGNLQAFLAAVRGGGAERTGPMMRTVTPERTKQHELLIAERSGLAMMVARLPPFTMPVTVDMVFVMEGDDATCPTASADGDTDNHVKAVLDGLKKGGVYTDDRQVAELRAIKLCGEGPATVIRIRPAAPVSAEWGWALPSPLRGPGEPPAP